MSKRTSCLMAKMCSVIDKTLQVPSGSSGPGDHNRPQRQRVPGREPVQQVRDKDLLGTPCRESGYLFSGLWRGKGKREGKKGEEGREGEAASLGERQKGRKLGLKVEGKSACLSCWKEWARLVS